MAKRILVDQLGYDLTFPDEGMLTVTGIRSDVCSDCGLSSRCLSGGLRVMRCQSCGIVKVHSQGNTWLPLPDGCHQLTGNAPSGTCHACMEELAVATVKESDLLDEDAYCLDMHRCDDQ